MITVTALLTKHFGIFITDSIKIIILCRNFNLIHLVIKILSLIIICKLKINRIIKIIQQATPFGKDTFFII